MGINKSKENQHCGTKPKKIAFGIAPLGIVSIGIVPMGVISIGVVPMGVFSFGAVAMGNSQFISSRDGNYLCRCYYYGNMGVFT